MRQAETFAKSPFVAYFFAVRLAIAWKYFNVVCTLCVAKAA